MTEALHDHPLRQGGSRPTGARRDIGSLVAPILIAIGAALLFGGYWGVSDSVDPGDQIPYLASATLPGLALVVGGIVLLLRAEQRRQRQQTEALVERFDAIIAWLGSAGDERPNGSDHQATPTSDPSIAP
ncbi:MAG TPA: hypothetical protein VFW63_12005 [Acidimicrobiales bacterium]|nr:hypothetical protein [Acidimicrobiales bacterium]